MVLPACPLATSVTITSNAWAQPYWLRTCHKRDASAGRERLCVQRPLLHTSSRTTAFSALHGTTSAHKCNSRRTHDSDFDVKKRSSLTTLHPFKAMFLCIGFLATKE